MVASNSMFGLPDELVIVIPDKNPFYSLYADGRFSRKTYNRETGESFFAYEENATVILYYTYPAHRAASVVRNVSGKVELPGLSKRVRLLFTVHASRVDKLKRAAGFLNKNAGGLFHFSDDFYTRLYFILLERGKLNYASLRNLAEKNREKIS